ncbi:MAG: hypothetical protein LBQ66_05500, partial [Planctomycetaceae bacterium]|nr:hypothetical protein [Planctomycetaceae bacterium]
MCRLSFRVVGVLLVMFFVGVFTSMLLAQPVAVSRDLHSRVASNDLSNHSADVNLPKLLIPDDAVIVPYQPDNITPSKLPKPEDLITPDQSVLVPLRLHLDMLDLINSSDLLRAKPRKQLPARIAVSSSEYLVTELPQTGEELVLQGKIHLYLYADDAELWLFNLSNGAIESPQLDGKPASISSASRTKFALLIAGKGEHVFSFKVRVKIHQQGGWRIAEGVLPTASASKVNLTLPTEAGDLLTGNQLDLRKWSSGKDAAGEKKSITTSLEPDGHFAWRWRSAISEGQVDRSLEVDSTIRFDLQDDAAWIIWKPTFKISHGKWDFFRLQIPKKYTIAEIVGENLRGWNIVEDAGNTGNTDNAENADNTDNTKKNDVQIINIELLKPAEKVETILIRLMESDAKIKSDVNGEVWKLSTLSVPEAGIHRGTIELYRSTIRSFRVTNAVGASLTDPPKNPLPTTSTKFDATSPLGVIPFQSYRFISEPFELTFASKRTEKQFSTKFQSVLKVTRQNTKLESKIEIYANNQPFFATITLPNQLNLKNVSLPDGIAYSKEAKDGKNLLYISNGSGIHNSVVVGIDGEYAQAKKFDNTKDNPKNINVQKNDTPKNEPPKPNTEPETIDDNSPETEVPPIIAPVHLADSILPTIQESTAPESTPAESNKSTPSQPESVVGKQYLIDELPVFSIKFAGSDLVQGSKSEYIELITEPSLVADAVKLVNCNIVDRQRSGYSTITPKDQLGLLRLVIRSYSQKFSGQLIFTEIDPIVRCSTITNVLTTNEAVEETILFDFSIERSGIREIKFTLPAWMRDAVIESPFLQRKRIAEREVGGGSNNAQSSGVVPARVVDVTLELQEDVIDRLSVLVRADRKLRTETDYKIVAPVVETGHVTSQYVVIENDRLSPDEMLVDSASIKNLKSLDRRQVEWNYLSSILGENVTEAYYSQKNESKQTNERSLRFRMKRRGAVRLSEARIDLAETSMIFDRNGEYRAEQIYHIDNKKEPYLDISLPKGGVILGVRLFSADEWNEAAMAEGWGVVHAGNGRHDEVRLLRDGMSVKPCLMSVEVAERYSQLKDVKKNLLEIQGSDMKYYANAARIPLVKTESGELDYVIRIVYAGSLNGFTNLGYVEMPFVDVLNIPVGESILLLNLPKQFQYFFNGNMQRIKDDQQISTLQKINLNYFTQL